MKYIYQYLITFKYKTDNIYKAQHEGEMKTLQGDFQQLHRDMFLQKCIVLIVFRFGIKFFTWNFVSTNIEICCDTFVSIR